MQDQDKTKEQLNSELERLCHRVTELEESEARLKEIERLLRESEQRFRLLYENAPLGYQSLDENGYFLEVNPAWLDMLGYSRKEVIGKWVGDFIAPDYLDRLKENFPKFKSVGEINGIEFVMLRKDGSRITVTVDGRIGYTEQRGFKQTHCILHGITERKLAEEAKVRSEKIYRQMFEGTSAVKLLVDPESGELIDANPATADFYGYTVDDLKRMKISDINALAPEQIFAEMTKAKMMHRSHCFFKHRLASGEIRDVEVHFSPLDLGDNRILYSIIHDITERKKSEEALRKINEELLAVIDASPVSIIAFDRDSIVKLWNPASEEIFGWSATEATGKFIPFIPEDKIEEHIGIRERALRGERLTAIEVRRKRKDGSSIDVRGSTAPLHDSEGRIAGVMALFMDITDRKKADEALRESEAKFRNLFNNAEVGMFRTRLDGSEIFDMNEKFLKIFGRTREEMRGNPSVIHWVDPHEREEMVRRLNADGRVTDFECKMLNKQGEVRMCTTSLKLYRELGVVEGVQRQRKWESGWDVFSGEFGTLRLDH